MAFGQPLTVERMVALFDEDSGVGKGEIREALVLLQEECADTGIELVEVASGFRYQARQENAPWVGRLWEEKPPRYSRALLETLVLIAYRQPITRGEIESIRGVSVSSQTVKTLLERDWVKVVGHRDVPGRPAIYATTKAFLDYFNLKSLDQLPSLSEIRDLDKIRVDGETDPNNIEAAAGENLETPVDIHAESALDEPEEEVSNEKEVVAEGELKDEDESDLYTDTADDDDVVESKTDVAVMQQAHESDEVEEIEPAMEPEFAQAADSEPDVDSDDDDFVDFSSGEPTVTMVSADSDTVSEEILSELQVDDDDFVDFSIASETDVDADDYDPEAEYSEDPPIDEPRRDYEEMYVDHDELHEDADVVMETVDDTQEDETDNDTLRPEKHAAAE